MLQLGPLRDRVLLQGGPATYQDLMRIAMWEKGLIYDDEVEKIRVSNPAASKVDQFSSRGNRPPLRPIQTTPKPAPIKIIGADAGTNVDSVRSFAQTAQNQRVMKKLRENASSPAEMEWWLRD